MALPIPDPFIKAAEVLGTFLGNVLAAILKKAEPELRAFLIGCIRDAITDKPSEISTRSESIHNAYTSIVGVRKAQGNIYPARSGDAEREVDSKS